MSDLKALLARSDAYLRDAYTRRIVEIEKQFKDVKEWPQDVISELGRMKDYLGKKK